MLTAVGTFAAVGFYALSRRIKGRKIPLPALAESADLNLSAFSDGENANCGRNLCWRWFPRIRPRNQGQEIPLPALAEGADLNLSAFSDGEYVDCGRNLCWRWLLRFQPRNQRQKIPISALAESADLNLSAFSDRKTLTAAGTLLLLISTHSAAESRTEVSGSSPVSECGPKPVRFWVATVSGMMASGAPTTE